MDQVLYRAANQGNAHILKDVAEKDPKVLTSVTPQGNTALHIAAMLGHAAFAAEVLRHSGDLLLAKNADDNTPLHVAAREGHSNVAEQLIGYAERWPADIESELGPFRMTNKQKNTPLHEAVEHRNLSIAIRLLGSDPLVGHLPNAKMKTPLHVAAREGLVEVVEEILKHPWVEEKEEQLSPVGTGSPLHQAVLGGHISVVQLLLKERNDLLRALDASGNNALHYAAQRNCVNPAKMVGMLISKEPSLAYLTNVDEGKSALHVAAASGSVVAIKELLTRCPDAAEQVDRTGMNALHIAVVNRSVRSLKCLLKYIKPREIINQVDKCGNTPLHYAAKQARVQSTLTLLDDKRVDPCVENMEGFTARKMLESLEEMDASELYIWTALKRQESRRCKKQQFAEASISRSFRKKMSTADEHFKSSAETYTLVTALIATVTFAATFTMPGGFNQSSGMAILAKQAAFKVFVISNTLAMCSSLIVMFCFIWAWKDPVKFKLYQLTWGHRLTVVACLAMLVTLMTAVYLVVAEECLWLAVVVCVICLTAPLVVLAILGYEVLFIPL